ncbi:MAG: SGNH/GDSL hydrolase family protein [Phycisphaerales bacterium]|nr:SGNH/GDSL hydrolase family protein [Phycisphaerales bacterium]
MNPIRGWCVALALVGLLCLRAETQDAVESTDRTWVDGIDLTVEGRGWPDDSTAWSRLPDHARDMVRDPVWNLSRHSSGIAIRFVTDSPDIRVEWVLTSDTLDMPHMPSTGVSGLDLYLRTETGWRWVNALRAGSRSNATDIVRNLSPVSREYMLFLPLYNGIESIRIGVLRGHDLEPAPPRPDDRRLPIVYYGTSIAQGACASRTGSCHVAILGRELDRPMINLGFSGNGRMELELAELLAEIEAEIYVIDCLPNLDGRRTAQRAGPFVRKLRELRPDTPILLVEDRTYGDAWINEARAKRTSDSRAALRAVFEELQAEGVEGITYLEGDQLLGDETEATVDGSHPNDLGFRRQAEAMEPVIRDIISR